MFRLIRRAFVGQCRSRMYLTSPQKKEPAVITRCSQARSHFGNHKDPLGMFEWEH